MKMSFEWETTENEIIHKKAIITKPAINNEGQ